MEKEEFERFIELLNRLKDDPEGDEMNFGEICELKEFGYQYSDFIDDLYRRWSINGNAPKNS